MTIERLKFADLHQDTLNPRLSEILDNTDFRYALERQKQLPRQGMKTLDITFSSLYRRADEAMKNAALTGNDEVLDKVRQDYYKIADYYRATNEFKIIEKPEDLQIKEEYAVNNIVLHLESGDIITRPEIIDELYERGVRSVGPLHNHDNQLGGGAVGDKNRGLTQIGKEIIDKLLAKGMIIDLAHANHKTAKDILERVGNYHKIMASHTSPGDGQRFVTPEIISEITRRGGIIGLTPAKPFFPSLNEYADGLKRISDLTGSISNLAIATDFGGLDPDQLFAEFDEIRKLSRLADYLVDRNGLSDEEISEIMFGNVDRLVKRL